MTFPKDLHLFCHVVDNFGDIGVCWRLARQYAHEWGLVVTLWVDDLDAFRCIDPSFEKGKIAQEVDGVWVKRWQHPFDVAGLGSNVDVVIEAFGCHLPEEYVAYMASWNRSPVWINLEYLSAEAWVETCHQQLSRHPVWGLDKYFFFPGITQKTGGLLRESGLIERRTEFQKNEQAIADFFSDLKVSKWQDALKISLFCYPDAPVQELFSVWQRSARPILCLVPEGVAEQAIASFFHQAIVVGQQKTRGALTVRVIPFLSQSDYEHLLWACDVNFVRGEDSFVRAQWAARPFVWQIYPQEEKAHWVKLDAFLDRYLEQLSNEMIQVVSNMWHGWNRLNCAVDEGFSDWINFVSCLPQLEQHGLRWSDHLLSNGDLAANLIRFAKTKMEMAR